MDLKWNPALFSFSLNSSGGQPEKQQPRKVLSSVIAGSWYPGDPKALRHEIGMYLAQAEAETSASTAGDDCNVFIIPHAGYQYSGLCAAYAYRHLQKRPFKRVMLLAPSHRVWLNNQCVAPEADAVSTPLGEIAVDDSLKRAFRKLKFTQESDRVHRDEHSTQIQYPFLQYVLEEGFTIFPVIVGKLTDETAQGLGEFLRKHLTAETVLIVSSDFTHYGSDFQYTPFSGDRIANVRKVDLAAYRYIQDHDPEGFHKYTEENHCTICGAEPIRAMLSMKPDSFESTLFRYCTSADDGSGDRRFVCYLSCGIKAVFEDDVLSAADKQKLLSFARRAIRAKFDTGKSPAPQTYREETSEGMRMKMGAFVTLNSPDGNLRGCIGEIEPYRPLYEAVTARACDAAFRDPRFFPLREGEFDAVRIEISALTPPKSIDDWRKIVIGKHGMTVTKHGRSAVFLPQVAPEQGWTLEETLSHLCRKAGLQADDYKSGATFTVFEAIVFSED